MTTDTQTAGAGLLAAILADPADDVPRLIYADWLEEQGDDSRAEFIRVQIELAKVLAGETPQRLPDMIRRGRWLDTLRRRERELLALPRRDRPHPDDSDFCYTNLRLWCEAAALVVPHGARIDAHITFRRGFVAALTCTAADWLAHADEITAAQPIEEVTFSDIRRRDMLRLQGDLAGVYLCRKGLPQDTFVSFLEWNCADLLAFLWSKITFHLPEQPVS